MATWSRYRGTIGDRSAVFATVTELAPVERALYPGCYVDLSPSTAIPAVDYVDTDSRAARFFADTARVRAELVGHARPGAGERIRFLCADYTRPLPLAPGRYDLLISLFAPQVWASCHRHLRLGGLLLADDSYGEASRAVRDPELHPVAVVEHVAGRYRLQADPAQVQRALPASPGAGSARSAWAYLFRRGDRMAREGLFTVRGVVGV